MTYTNELEVTVDFSDVDPSLLDDLSNDALVSTVQSSSSTDNDSTKDNKPSSELVNTNNLGKSESSGKSSRFFRKKS